MIDSSPPSLFGWIDLDVIGTSGAEEELSKAVDGPITRVSGTGVHCVTRRQDIRVVELHRGGVAFVAGRPLSFGGGMEASDREISAALSGAAEKSPGGAPSLLGRFSIVHVDRNNRHLSLLTDRFAVHPMCYAIEGRKIAFSDRADALPLRESPTIDPQALFNYAYFHVLPAPRTIFRGVSRMEPAQRLSFSDRGLALATTWNPTFDIGQEERREPAFDEFRDLVRAAVAREGDGERVGAFLSGGTDSSTVAGMLRAVTGVAPEVFSIGFDSAGFDEIEYAKIAARHFGCRHHIYYVTPDDVAASASEIAGYYDQPFGNSSVLPSYYCARLARESGITQVLAGDGGDELFGGNVRYARQKALEFYPSLLPAAVRRGMIEPVIFSRLARATPGLRKIASYVAQASIPMPERLETYNLLHRYGVSTLFTSRFLEAVDAEDPVHLQRRIYAESEGAALVDRMLAYDWRFTLADNDLPKVVGACSVAGVGVRFPMLDDSLVDFSLRLAPNQKVRGLTLRHWFKQALAGFLPAEIIRKRKHGFGLPFGPWLVKNPSLQRLARESVDALIERGLIRPTAVSHLFSSELERHPAYFGEMIWILMMAEHWLRRAAPRWRLD